MISVLLSSPATVPGEVTVDIDGECLREETGCERFEVSGELPCTWAEAIAEVSVCMSEKKNLSYHVLLMYAKLCQHSNLFMDGHSLPSLWSTDHFPACESTRGKFL